MAEPNPPLHPSKLPTPKFRNPNPQAQQASARFLSSFLYKVIFFTIVIALLPLFPSQTPESVNQSLFTRSWELLQLLIVGIAISYGIFSRRNTEPELEKEAAWKADSPQSYISQILHVSPDFDDDEVDSPDGPLDESKIQTWSSQYYRNNPVVVVRNDGTDAGHATNKPLYLPVRSLKSCAQDSGLMDYCNEFIDEYPGSVNRIEESRNFDALNSENGPEGIAVLRSPIPWRSRSGRMEVNDGLALGTGMAPAPSCSLPPSILEADSGPCRTPFRSPVTRTPSTPNRLAPSPSLSPEMRAKSSEDLGRKKSFYKSTPPPAPPPPPPPPFLGHGYSHISDKKVVSKSFKDELEDLSRRGRKDFPSAKGFGPSMSSSKPRNEAESYSVGWSVRTVRAKEVPSAMPDRVTKIGAEQSFGYEAHQPPLVPRYQAETRNEFMEKVIISTDESDADDAAGESSDKEVVSNSVAEAAPQANEVDKKADEFIAKFREQIRLQRIESIKKSSGRRSPRNQFRFLGTDDVYILESLMPSFISFPEVRSFQTPI
ncbi:putative serine/arginine repetitive matrix protein 1-like [Cocos nucifera]|uniref:Putative serine/arginine repetitive matrix protein 1-like n=1 Tax=Cocos nucifera TaxID=13894 RepID=A0A8K0IF29_COCNU|nr:putative serine/arginine repetitive matrix protein 1-like [Cocos nucifera]